jgi:hypothetical protein
VLFGAPHEAANSHEHSMDAVEGVKDKIDEIQESDDGTGV